MDKSIKDRLDLLDVGFDGSIFKEEMKKGWKVRTSNNGLKIATLEIDYRDLTWTSTSSLNGMYLCSQKVNENLPAGIFTYSPMVDISVTSIFSEFCFTIFSSRPPSTTYVGESYIGVVDIANSGSAKPSAILAIITAIGF